MLQEWRARCKYGLELHDLIRPPYSWHKLTARLWHVWNTYGKDRTSVKFARHLHGARTISHDVLKITVRPCVKPQGQGELTFRTHCKSSARHSYSYTAIYTHSSTKLTDRDGSAWLWPINWLSVCVILSGCCSIGCDADCAYTLPLSGYCSIDWETDWTLTLSGMWMPGDRETRGVLICLEVVVVTTGCPLMATGFMRTVPAAYHKGSRQFITTARNIIAWN